VLAAVSGGFCQLNHGNEAPLKRMQPGDRLLYYSPREGMGGGEPVQAFTAIGEILDRAIRQESEVEGFSFSAEMSNISTHAKRLSNRFYCISHLRVPRPHGDKYSGAAPFGLSAATIS